VWLWCQLTSGHERAAPIPRPDPDALSVQERFTHHGLRPVRERLLILGELLLETPSARTRHCTTDSEAPCTAAGISPATSTSTRSTR